MSSAGDTSTPSPPGFLPILTSDLAVAVIIGAAFTAIVTSFVTNVLSPLIASLVGKPDFSALTLYINGGKITYGTFLNSVISFLLQAAVVYFVIVVPMNYVIKQLQGKPTVPDPATAVLDDLHRNRIVNFILWREVRCVIGLFLFC